MGHLLSCIYPCFQLWITSPLWVTCSVVSAHASSTGLQVLYGSLVRLYLSMLSALDHKSSLGRLFYCICPCLQHWITSPLWVACSVVSVHALSTGSQVLYGSLVRLSQVLYGSLVRLYLSMLSALDHKSSLGHLFSFIVFVYSLVLSLSLLSVGIQI